MAVYLLARSPARATFPFASAQKIVRRRPDLRIIISSATIEAEHFARFFNHPAARFPPEKRAHVAMRPLDSQHPSPQSALLSVEGRPHPVQVSKWGAYLLRKEE